MPDPTPGAGITSKQSVRLRYKIICCAVAWLAALFATNPNGGLWGLAWVFSLRLASFFDSRGGHQRRLGSFCGLHCALRNSRLVLFPVANVALDTFSFWRPCDSAHLQRVGVPLDD